MCSNRDRCSMIVRAFGQAYFGHVPLELAVWSELDMFCDNLLAGLRNARSKRTEKEGDCLEDEDLTHFQSSLFEVIEHHPLNAYPVSERQRSRSIRWIRNAFQRNGESITSEDLSRLIEAENRSETVAEESEFVFKTFDRLGTAYVTLLEENRNLIGHGTTGLTSWQGAVFLSDWGQNHAFMLKGKRILELGSGTGFFGISLLKSTPVKEYTFTDCHHNVLNFLIHNMRLNFPPNSEPEYDMQERLEQLKTGPPTIIKEEKVADISYHQKINEGCTEVAIQHLDWLDYDLDRFRKADLILGSDIVYERSLLPGLCGLIRALLQRSDSADPAAYIACTERSHTTLGCFEKAMEEEDLRFKVIHKGIYSPTEAIFNSDVQHQPTRLYKIELEQKENPAGEEHCL